MADRFPDVEGIIGTVRAARANRLARLSDRRQGWRAGLAGRILAHAAERGDENAIEAIWQAWLRDPGDETWGSVSRWRAPVDVFAAAVDPGRSAVERGALGAFCARHDLVPDNVVERAVFFVLTGRREQYQALDPDGSLLAGGYRGADEATREVLRDTMVGLGELNLVRVIADRPDHPPTAEEADYLARRLADAREWEQLWRLVPTIPLASAARAARLFTGWRPSDDLGRAFFERLAGTGPAAITAPASTAVTRIELGFPYQFSFAPDGSELAIKHRKGTTIYEPRTGRQIAHHPGRQQLHVLALGDGVIVHKGGRGNGWSITRCDPGRPPEVLLPRQPGSELRGTPAGIVVCSDNRLLFRPAGSGSWSRVVPAKDLRLGKHIVMLDLVDVEPETGRLAVRILPRFATDELVLFEADLTVLARVHREGHHDGAFCGPERLLRWWWGGDRITIESWRRDGDRLVRTATVDVDDRSYLDPVPLPARNMVVIRRRPRGLTWLDADTLTEVDGPEGFSVVGAHRLAFSLDGSLAAVAPVMSSTGAEVHDLGLYRIAALLGRPLAGMTLVDLRTVRALAKREVSPRVKAAVALLLAGLKYRFGADVALGSGDRIAGGSDDIALGGR